MMHAMVFNLNGSGTGGGATDDLVGESYGAFLVRTTGTDVDIAGIIREVLPSIRFTGWITPEQDGRIVVIGHPGAAVVASKRRGIVEVASVVAARTMTPVLAIQVKEDRQLALVAWEDGEENARYCSDPSREPDADDDVLDSPVGAEGAAVLARVCGKDEKAADELEELLDEGIDPDSTSESERLRTVMRLLDLPSWLVAIGSLPRRLSIGPTKASMTRLRAGRTGLLSVALNDPVRRVREKWSPPPIIDDPPSMDMSGFDPLFM
jgi:hypothetical protein